MFVNGLKRIQKRKDETYGMNHESISFAQVAKCKSNFVLALHIRQDGRTKIKKANCQTQAIASRQEITINHAKDREGLKEQNKELKQQREGVSKLNTAVSCNLQAWKNFRHRAVGKIKRSGDGETRVGISNQVAGVQYRYISKAGECAKKRKKNVKGPFRTETISKPSSPTPYLFISLLNLFVGTVYASASSMLTLLVFFLLWVVKCPDNFLPF